MIHRLLRKIKQIFRKKNNVNRNLVGFPVHFTDEDFSSMFQSCVSVKLTDEDYKNMFKSCTYEGLQKSKL